MGATTFEAVMVGLEIASLTVYVIFLYTIYKYRDRVPFSSPFFKLMFVIGIIDIVHQIEEIFLFKFPTFAWCGMHKVVTTLPYFFGKFHVIFGYYFAHAQIFAVLLVAINRVSVCAFLKDLTPYQLRMTFVVLWALPLLANVPLWNNEFYFSINEMDGGAVFNWKNANLRWYYLLSCAILCSGVAILSGLCYVVVVVKAHQVRQEVAKAKKPEEQNSREERKLILIGVVLTAIVGFCGFACFRWAYAIEPVKMRSILPLVIVNGDLLNWVNPYLLLACSKAVRKDFKAVLFCRPVNDVYPFEQ